MGNVISKHWPMIVAIVILELIVAGLAILSINQNEGHLVYPIDDTYIHMAIAKNFV